MPDLCRQHSTSLYLTVPLTMWRASSKLPAERVLTRWLQVTWAIWSIWWLGVDQCSYLTPCVKIARFSFPGEVRELASLMVLLSGYPLSDLAAGILDCVTRLLRLDSLHSGIAMAVKDAVYLSILAVSGYFQWFVLVPRLSEQLRRLFKFNT